MQNILHAKSAKSCFTVYNMSFTAKDFKEAIFNSLLGRHFHPSHLEINTASQMLGSSWSTVQPRAEMILSVWLHKEMTGNRKPSLTENPVTMGEGTEACVCLCVWHRISLATGKKKLLTSWLHSKTRLRASAGYLHEVREFYFFKSWYKEKYSLLVFYLYWNELSSLLCLCVVNTESPNVCILLILLCLAFPRLSSLTLCFPPAVVNTTWPMIAHAFQSAQNIDKEPKLSPPPSLPLPPSVLSPSLLAKVFSFHDCKHA